MAAGVGIEPTYHRINSPSRSPSPESRSRIENGGSKRSRSSVLADPSVFEAEPAPCRFCFHDFNSVGLEFYPRRIGICFVGLDKNLIYRLCYFIHPVIVTSNRNTRYQLPRLDVLQDGWITMLAININQVNTKR